VRRPVFRSRRWLVVNQTSGMQRKKSRGPLWFAAADPLNRFHGLGLPVVATRPRTARSAHLARQACRRALPRITAVNVCVDPTDTIPSAEFAHQRAYDITVARPPPTRADPAVPRGQVCPGGETFQRVMPRTPATCR